MKESRGSLSESAVCPASPPRLLHDGAVDGRMGSPQPFPLTSNPRKPLNLGATSAAAYVWRARDPRVIPKMRLGRMVAPRKFSSLHALVDVALVSPRVPWSPSLQVPTSTISSINSDHQRSINELQLHWTCIALLADGSPQKLVPISLNQPTTSEEFFVSMFGLTPKAPTLAKPKMAKIVPC